MKTAGVAKEGVSWSCVGGGGGVVDSGLDVGAGAEVGG